MAGAKPLSSDDPASATKIITNPMVYTAPASPFTRSDELSRLGFVIGAVSWRWR
jgi:hypothetical protein